MALLDQYRTQAATQLSEQHAAQIEDLAHTLYNNGKQEAQLKLQQAQAEISQFEAEETQAVPTETLG